MNAKRIRQSFRTIAATKMTKLCIQLLYIVEISHSNSVT